MDIEFDFDNKTIFNVPKELKDKIQTLQVTNIYSGTDVNQVLAEYLVKERKLEDILNKSEMMWYDWANLKGACERSGGVTFTNNGTLMEYLSQILISKIFNVRSLIKYTELNFETAEQGLDIIFCDSLLNIYVYEVKSKVSEKRGAMLFCERIKAAIVSLYCSKELRNQKKLALARCEVENGMKLDETSKLRLFDLLNIIDVNENDFVALAENEGITLNICLIGNGFNVSQSDIDENLVECINSRRGCKDSCKGCKEDSDIISKMGKIKLLNVVSIEFAKELDMEKLNSQIVKIINDERLDQRNG